MSDRDTIYALSSALGQSGVAVIRVSGMECNTVLKTLTQGKLSFSQMTSHKAILRNLYDGDTGNMVDSALLLPFHAPHSFTGEDVLEIQCHGSKAVLKKLFSIFSTLPDLRPATAGEFSRRAFLNGKMDIIQVEGLLDLIHAETEQQRRFATDEYGGKLSTLFEKMREELINTQAFLEAGIDFADEEIPDSVFEQSCETVRTLQNTLRDLMKGVKVREKIREGFKIAIVGSPNAGKSTLMNALTGRDMAIVSDIAGTTRDTLEAYLDFNGFPITLLDTAGLRETENVIEKEGINRAKHHINTADIVLYLIDATLLPVDLSELETVDPTKTFIVLNKVDLLEDSSVDASLFGDFACTLTLSAKQEQGVENLKKQVALFLEEHYLSPQASNLLLRERYVHHLKAIDEYLDRFLDSVSGGHFYIELLAEELRAATAEFSKISGRIHIDQIYDKIFSSFCIGK